jgi:hypothetical protein
MAGEILAQLPEDLRTNEAFTGMNTAGDIAKAYLDEKGKVQEFDGKVKTLEGKHSDLEKKIASDYIPKLPENATAEQVKAHNIARGWPEDPAQYEFPEVDGKPNSPQTVEWARKMFHENGVPKDMAKNISVGFNQFLQGILKADLEAKKKSQEDAEAQMKIELGNAYDARKELADRFWAKHFANDPTLEAFLKETPTGPLGNDPRLIRLILKTAKLTGEDLSPSGSPKGGKPEPVWFPNTQF